MRYWTIPLLLLTIWSCKKNDTADIDTSIKVENQLLTGTILLNDTIVEEISFNSCFCNLTDKGLKITHELRGGFVGQSLITEVARDTLSVYPHFRTWSDVGASRIFSATDTELKLNKNKFQLSDTVQGEIKIKGFSNNYGADNDLRVTFSIDGNFKCILKDTSYTYKSFEAELIKKYNNERWEKLKNTASKYPDSVTVLNLNGRGLKEIPQDIRIFSKLKSLNLNGNEISELNAKLLADLPDLEKIDLSNNQIHEIPAAIYELRKLRALDLSGNPIKELPRVIFQLNGLEELSIAETEITNLSTEIRNLKELKNLNIGYTRIRKIPTQVFGLKNLEELSLPDSIELFRITNLNFSSLKTLWAPFDFLVYNKADIKKLSQLESLYPRYFYLSHDDYMKRHGGQAKWLEDELPGVDISSITWTADN